MTLYVNCFFTKEAFPILIEDYLEKYEIDVRGFLRCSIIRFYLDKSHLNIDNGFLNSWKKFNINNIVLYNNENILNENIIQNDRSIIFCKISEKSHYEKICLTNSILICIDDDENFLTFFSSILTPKNFEITENFEKTEETPKFITNWENFNLPITFIHIQHPYLFDLKFENDLLDETQQKIFIHDAFEKIKIFTELISINSSNIQQIELNLIIAKIDNLVFKYKNQEQKIIIENITSGLIYFTRNEINAICKTVTHVNIWSRIKHDRHKMLKSKPHQRFLISDYFFLSSHIEFDKPGENIEYETIFTRPDNYIKKLTECTTSMGIGE